MERQWEVRSGVKLGLPNFNRGRGVGGGGGGKEEEEEGRAHRGESEGG